MQTKQLKNNPRVALATEFLVQHGGAQKTLEAIAELFPEAPIFTAKYDPKGMTETINNRKIISPQSNFINQASKYFFTFMMAPVFESFDFRDYDIIISDGTTWTKGIIAKPGQLHISYVHTPPRFLYGYSTESTKRNKWYFKLFFSYIDNMFRMWDFVAAQRPDYLLTNSKETLSRIKKFYRRDATVIYPPVDVEVETTETSKEKGNYYLSVGRLAAYKNFDLLIKTFNELKLPLIMVGTGAMESSLKKIADEDIKFVGRVNDKEKHNLIENCLGLINTVQDEDFGIVPIEAMGHGKPVLAHRSGGHLETVDEKISGLFFDELTVENLKEKVLEFDKKIKEGFYNSDKIKKSVQNFSKEQFKEDFWDFVSDKWNAFNK